MTIKITVPELGESVVEATVGEWHKREGERVAVGDVLVELETDKVDLEVSAETAGVLARIFHQQGADVQIGDVLAEIERNGEAATAEKPAQDETPAPAPAEKPAEEPRRAVTPVAQRVAAAEGVDVSKVEGSGAHGRVTRQDVEKHLQKQEAAPAKPQPQPVAAPSSQVSAESGNGRTEERIRMSRRRRTIAQRLVEAQHTAAMLTTFNDVDMGAVMELRKRRGPAFLERHGVKLGFMSFFVKAAVGALKAFPKLNAEIDGEEMVLKQYYDIGMAVGAEEGLVVPVIRDADRLSFAAIEQAIRDFSARARDGSLTLEDLRGGTFTITNGGVFGSMLSTPILNPPQVGILGLHRIDERPVARNGEVVIRPMMYLALSYDHRLVDGREAVQFLARVKELIEEPETLLLEG
ncbi:MAG: 2-oxoglutarate dehydrogenase complex dihydrolipoyllysine-residue succinyltransferase [Chloroflexi bacterium]|nr:2-oxoglutarate dehydrogenase complex dihydrolipoyllysine-residue succinyltransferase [Ardenticatenaceae bacterium]MBL1128508.1 2-oxoglutarate dehydrogenase complex dihydrolipoyllysine-residue succinyltransferase [Chloroflexota bacterium]NOG34586.1 2-oxoglutarate dehydrogenase complex dihydrolipoyllysine-residue succinyltransferase [Chloroflexota bacterium]GIK56666.1 MAG: dihydrolipoyllysine-residue succinyltransferase component of 2-oxoglutarate dehydrogenase complex [Chloroflexota bacterium]